MTTEQQLHCSICGNDRSQVKKLISGVEGAICNECIERCHNFLVEAEQQTAETQEESEQQTEQVALPTPHQIQRI